MVAASAGIAVWQVSRGTDMAAAVGEAAVWAAIWGALMWWFDTKSAKDTVTNAMTTDILVPAEVLGVKKGKRITVCVAGGSMLGWDTTKMARTLVVGQQVWLAPPAGRGDLITAVADTGQSDEAVVLWPRGPARPPGRWD